MAQSQEPVILLSFIQFSAPVVFLLLILWTPTTQAGRCATGYRECPDGICVRDAIGISCTEECSSGEKKCSDGLCVAILAKCVDLVCPLDSPNQCPGTTKCYSNEQQCDNEPDCPDGSDEELCARKSTSPFNNAWYAASIVPGVLLVLACLYVVTKHKGRSQDISGGLLRLRAFPTSHGTTITTDLEVTSHLSTRPLTTNGHVPVSAQSSRASRSPHVSDVHIGLNDSSSAVGLFRTSYHEGDTLSASIGIVGAGSSIAGSTASSEKPLEPSAPPMDDSGSGSTVDHHKTLTTTLSNGIPTTNTSPNHTSPNHGSGILQPIQSSTRLLHPHNDNSSGGSSCAQTCYGGTSNSCAGVVNGDQSSEHSGDYEVIDFVTYNTTNGAPTNGTTSTAPATTSNGSTYSGPPSGSGETGTTGSVGPPPTYEEALNHHRRDSCPTYGGTSLLRGQSESDARVYESNKSEPRHLQFLPSCKHRSRLKRHLMDDLTSDSDFMSSSSSDEQSDGSYD